MRIIKQHSHFSRSTPVPSNKYQDIQNNGMLCNKAFNEQYCTVVLKTNASGLSKNASGLSNASGMSVKSNTTCTVEKTPPVLVQAPITYGNTSMQELSQETTATIPYNYSTVATESLIKNEEVKIQSMSERNIKHIDEIRDLIKELDQKRRDLLALTGEHILDTNACPSVASVISNGACKQEMTETENRMNTREPPPVKVQGEMYIDKNAKRRAAANKKRAEQDIKAGLIQEHEQENKKKLKTFLSGVNTVELQRTKHAKQCKAEFKVIIKKHGLTRGYLEAQVKIENGDEAWFPVSSFWWPQNVLVYLPAWQKYCQKKVLPDSWKYLGALPSVSEYTSGKDTSKQGLFPKNPTLPPTIVKMEEDEEVGTPEEAVCIGHALNKKGRVYMKLKWLDNKEEDSIHPVSLVLGCEKEKKKFKHTWLAYCNKKKLDDELFREKGVSVVRNVIGHWWSEGGRPVVEVEWKHGEHSKVNVVDVLEVGKADLSGYNIAWNAYCDTLEEIGPGFRKGLVEKAKKVVTPASKKRRPSV